jgi:hypothetical protein
MIRRLLVAMAACAALTSVGPPSARAGGALIETTAPLVEHSEAAVKAAVIVAIDKAVRGAVAMGYPWVQLRHAQISGDEVAVQILATDEEPGSPSAGPPDERPEATDERDPADDSATEDRVPATTRLNV